MKECGKCEGRLRPGVVLFGENLPLDAFRAAEKWANEAGVFITLGSSLQVSPANQFPQIAKQNGAYLILCNRDETTLDYLFDRVNHEEISTFLNGIDGNM